MKEVSRQCGILLPVSLVLLAYSSQINAGCSREDVGFYLEKGFTTDQITKLCSTGSGAAATETANTSKPPGTEQYPAEKPISENEMFLKTAVKASDIHLGNDALHYTQKICIEYGEEDLFGFTPNVCPNVKFVVALKNLEVLRTGKKYGFYGTKEVWVKSAIKREIIGGLKDKSAEEKELIFEKFEKGNETAVPVRDDFSRDRVKTVLQELSIK